VHFELPTKIQRTSRNKIKNKKWVERSSSLDHLPTNIALLHFRKAYMQVTTLAMPNGTLINTIVGPIVINNWGFKSSIVVLLIFLIHKIMY
jgi:uncharacterized membrane protein